MTDVWWGGDRQAVPRHRRPAAAPQTAAIAGRHPAPRHAVAVGRGGAASAGRPRPPPLVRLQSAGPPAAGGAAGGWTCAESRRGPRRERAAAGGGGGIAGARLCGTIRTSITTARKPAPPPTRPVGDDVGGRRLAAGPWPGQGGAAMTRVHLQLLISGGRRSTTGGRGDGGWTAQSQLWRGVSDAVVPAHLPPRW